MGWFTRASKPQADPHALPDPPVISEHAQEVLEKARDTRKLLERFLTENHFAGNMKKTLRRPGKKKA